MQVVSDDCICIDWLWKLNNQILLGFSDRCIVWCWLTATMWWEGLFLYLTFYKPWFSLLQVLMHCTPNSTPSNNLVFLSVSWLSVRLPICLHILHSFLLLRPIYAPSPPVKAHVPTDQTLLHLQFFILLKTMRVFLLFLWNFLVLKFQLCQFPPSLRSPDPYSYPPCTPTKNNYKLHHGFIWSPLAPQRSTSEIFS